MGNLIKLKKTLKMKFLALTALVATTQERCVALAAEGVAQTITAVTTPAVTAVLAVAVNVCSVSGEVGGNNAGGTCVVCAAAAVTAAWPAACIESAAILSASLAGVAYLMA